MACGTDPPGGRQRGCGQPFSSHIKAEYRKTGKWSVANYVLGHGQNLRQVAARQAGKAVANHPALGVAASPNWPPDAADRPRRRGDTVKRSWPDPPRFTAVEVDNSMVERPGTAATASKAHSRRWHQTGLPDDRLYARCVSRRCTA